MFLLPGKNEREYVVEETAIPLIKRMNGGYSKYMEDANTSSVTTQTPIHGSFGITSPFDNIGCKLGWRKLLINSRRMFVNTEFILALIGIIIILIETELFFNGVITKTDPTSIILKATNFDDSAFNGSLPLHVPYHWNMHPNDGQ